MPMPVEELRGHLAEAFPDAEIVIDDLALETSAPANASPSGD